MPDRQGLPAHLRLIDSHCHIQSERFEADRGDVLATAAAAGVERILVPGYDLPSSLGAIELAGRLALDASAGIHPHVAAEAGEDTWAQILDLALRPEVVAVGETGLDYDRGFSPRDAQLSNLRRHLALANDTGLPAILHCRSRPGERDAQDDLLRELSEAGSPPAVLHSFSGPIDYAARALELGLSISFSGLVFRSGEEISAEVAKLVPRERVLVETDSPYLSPPGADRRRNEPRWVAITAHWLAEQRGEDPHALGEALVANYDRLFSRRPNSPG